MKKWPVTYHTMNNDNNSSYKPKLHRRIHVLRRKRARELKAALTQVEKMLAKLKKS